MGDASAALADLDAAIQADGNYVKALCNRGVLKEKLQDTAGALQDYGQAIQTDPTFVPPYINRAILRLESSGNCEGALEVCCSHLHSPSRGSRAFNGGGGGLGRGLN